MLDHFGRRHRPRLCLAFLVGAALFLQTRPATASTASAAKSAVGWIEQQQNADGSWGGTQDIRPLYTAATVDALRDYNDRSPSYFFGVTWLENRAMGNVDYHARRAAALAPHGDDVTVDRDFLKTAVSKQLQAASGWGLSAAYAPSARDTALALLAFGAIGVAPDVSADVQAALDFLKSSQAADGSWRVSGSTAGDPVVTAVVLRALASQRSFDPTVATNGDAAATYLQNTVTTSASALQQAQAALALLRWNGAGSATTLLNSLVASQTVNGSWNGDPYVTAVALDALAADLGRDSASFQAVVPIPDFALRTVVNLRLGHNRGDAIRRGDLKDLTVLPGNNSGITDLSGLEDATNLTVVDLRNTNVSDITPIAGLIGTATILLQNTPWAGLMCDVNNDGVIDVGDALMAMRIASGALVPTLLQKTRADVEPVFGAPTGPGDGVVGPGDVLMVSRRGGAGISNSVCP